MNRRPSTVGYPFRTLARMPESGGTSRENGFTPYQVFICVRTAFMIGFGFGYVNFATYPTQGEIVPAKEFTLVCEPTIPRRVVLFPRWSNRAYTHVIMIEEPSDMRWNCRPWIFEP